MSKRGAELFHVPDRRLGSCEGFRSRMSCSCPMSRVGRKRSQEQEYTKTSRADTDSKMLCLLASGIFCGKSELNAFQNVTWRHSSKESYSKASTLLHHPGRGRRQTDSRAAEDSLVLQGKPCSSLLRRRRDGLATCSLQQCILKTGILGWRHRAHPLLSQQVS